MKIVTLLSLLFAGCSTTVAPLAEFPGWSWAETGSERFKIHVGTVSGDRVDVALRYAALLTLQKGYSAFEIIEEDGKGESGTWFVWTDGYDPDARGIWNFEPGKSFEIHCRHKAPTKSERWFAPKRFVSEVPIQPPEPTRAAVRDSGDSPAITVSTSSARAAHL